MNKVTLSKGLLDPLLQLRQLGGEADLIQLEMPRSIYANFAMLRYWGFMDPVYRPNGTRVRGRWRITQKGCDFLDGEVKVYSSLWRSQGNFIAWEEASRQVFVHEVATELTHPDPVTPIW